MSVLRNNEGLNAFVNEKLTDLRDYFMSDEVYRDGLVNQYFTNVRLQDQKLNFKFLSWDLFVKVQIDAINGSVRFETHEIKINEIEYPNELKHILGMDAIKHLPLNSGPFAFAKEKKKSIGGQTLSVSNIQDFRQQYTRWIFEEMGGREFEDLI